MSNPSVTKLHELLAQGKGICIDSRQGASNSIFFALKGKFFDGNRFALNALENGCQLAVVDDPSYKNQQGCLLVENAFETLQQLANYHRLGFNIPVIGITGSNGKTTTKELVYRVLAMKFVTHATQGNLNNHIGVPLTLLSYNSPLEMAVVEMGANHVGDIKQLCNIAQPTYGIITNIGKAHLEGFGSVENIAKGKGELYDHIRNSNGIIFINNDHQVLVNMSGGINKVTFGKGEQNHVTARIIEDFPFVKISFRTNGDFGKARAGTQGEINSNLTGAYNAENILAAATIGLYFGVEPQKIIQAIESYEPTNSRSQIINTQANVLIMDAYNANPTSMQAALENFHQFNDLPRIAILGDMLEMGNSSDSEHRAIAETASKQGNKLVIFVGPEFGKTVVADEHNIAFANSDDAAQWLKQNPLNGYRVLIKGSRGIKLEKLIEYL
jgi:UDP-N-acetylmuramoyl-tripeptide--D-alanyl-D-alanine ligase